MSKKRFILDYCIIMNAAKLSDSRGNSDWAAFNALTSIVGECHHIVLTRKMQDKYFEKIELLQKDKLLQFDITTILANAAVVKGKFDWKHNNLESVAGEKLVHKNDSELLRLAHISKGIIVTSDERLVKALENNNFKDRYGVQYVKPENIRRILNKIDSPS